MQGLLPDDPFADCEMGTRYLRLTNDCPDDGVVLSLTGPPSKVTNDNFGGEKEEYQWPIVHYLPDPVNKTLTESSVGFRAAVKAATSGDPYEKPLHIRWTKVPGTKGRTFKEWSIRLLSEADFAGAFGNIKR